MNDPGKDKTAQAVLVNPSQEIIYFTRGFHFPCQLPVPALIFSVQLSLVDYTYKQEALKSLDAEHYDCS